jgi:hypothetical protein
LPLGNHDDSISEVGDVDVNILALMALLVGVLGEVGLHEERAVRDQEPRESLFDIALDLRLPEHLSHFGEVSIGCEDLSEENFEGTGLYVLFGANCFRLESAKHNY